MNEDDMTEVEIRAGEGLERQLERYARVRLDPSAAQARRARATVMEAAWRQRFAGRGPTEAQPGPRAAGRPHRPLFAGWGPRRVGVSMTAAVLAGLLVGSSTFASSRAGGPLYEARLALEVATLPADPGARLEAELAMAQARLAEIVEAIAKGDPGAVSAAARGYLAAVDGLSVATGAPADRAQTAIAFHRTVLLEVLGRVPEEAQAGIEQALASSSKAITRLNAAGTTPETNESGGAGSGEGTGSGQGPGSDGGHGSGQGGGGGGGADVPSSDPGPARSPKPPKSASPVDEEPARTPRTKPDPPPASDESGEQDDQGGQP